MVCAPQGPCDADSAEGIHEEDLHHAGRARLELAIFDNRSADKRWRDKVNGLLAHLQVKGRCEGHVSKLAGFHWCFV